MYALLWIPRTGLFYSGNHFRNGEHTIVDWDKTIPIFKTSQRAEEAREKILAAHPSAKGELIVFNVTLREMP
jgi:hypothetical protein